MRARVLIRKLSFLQRLVLGDGSNLGSRMFRSLTYDVESVNLVRECRELEEVLGTKYTDMILKAEGGGSHPRDLKKEVMRRDKEQRLDRCSHEDRAPVVAHIARTIGWEKLWDTALDEGPRCIQQMKHLVKTLCHRCFGGTEQDCPCLHKEVTQEMLDSLAIMDFKFLKTF